LKHTKEFKRIPLTSECLDFINYVKKTFPEFNGSLFSYNSVASSSNYVPSVSKAKYTKVTAKASVDTVTTKATEVTTKAYPSDQEIPTKATKIPTKDTNISITYPKDQKAKTAKDSLRSIYLWIYEKINYLFILFPCLIILILAIKDNPELIDAYIKE
jgi:hypothetical protein